MQSEWNKEDVQFESRKKLRKNFDIYQLFIVYFLSESPATKSPNLKHGVVLAGVQKKLLKFLYFGKQRKVNVDLKRDHVTNLEIIEGNFLTIQCDLDKVEKKKEVINNVSFWIKRYMLF